MVRTEDAAVPEVGPQVLLGGCVAHLRSRSSALLAIEGHLTERRKALGVVSLNLDHLHHFRPGGPWAPALDQAETKGRLSWLNLVDGAPLATQSRRLTGQEWPRLAGSDLVDDILDIADRLGTRVGFLGGAPATQELLAQRLREARPDLVVSGWWAPERHQLVDPAANAQLAEQIRSSGTELLVVALGKPRQELWIAHHGAATGAKVLLAFGAVVDFLAGRISRAPRWMSEHSLEWSYRLALEPRRLAHRYLVDGPPAYVRLRRDSSLRVPAPRAAAHDETIPSRDPVVTAVVVTYQSGTAVGGLLDDLAREAGDTPLRVVVKDNGSTDGTLSVLAGRPKVEILPDRTNVGYAAGINAAVDHARRTGASPRSWLVLNPDVRLRPGALSAMQRRLDSAGVGVVVPRIVDTGGATYPSLRRTPTPGRTIADAVLGSHRAGRLSETERDPLAYTYAHPIDWATGAVLLVDEEVAREVGPWDERFFLYSEETDFLARVRGHGSSVWYEPAAVVEHAGQGSGTSTGLAALMAVNRVRFAELHRGRTAGRLTRAALVVGALLRLGQPERRATLPYLVRRSRWAQLPSAPESKREQQLTGGAVIIPAHDEAAVIGRTLGSLARLAEQGAIEVIVAANGCHDGTADVARSYVSVSVIDLPDASKVSALNAADGVASQWPRLYVDADIEITERAVLDVLGALARSGGPLAARPPVRYDASGAVPLVRAYYRARARLALEDGRLWGAGVYGLSRTGHQRFTTFPDVIADDLFVDGCFSRDEKVVVPTDPVIVRTPRTLDGLLAVLRRSVRGNAELHRAQLAPDSSLSTSVGLLRSLRGPGSWVDAGVYVVLAVTARAMARRAGAAWDRDESSRSPAGGAAASTAPSGVAGGRVTSWR